jgi:putative PIN family toxin of toxin-antitoxin system
LLDTNVWVAALIWGGAPYSVVKLAATPPHQIFTSATLLDELKRTLSYLKLASHLQARGLNVQNLMEQVSLIVHDQDSPTLQFPVCRDADDDAVLACALAAQADLIVSGDQDLLVLRAFDGIQIVTALQALERLSV